MKTPPSEWEKIFANKVTKKGLLFKMYKQLMKVNIKKQPNEKMGGRCKYSCFSKEDIEMAKKHIKKMLNITNY